MPGLSQIKRPTKGEHVCDLWKIVDANVVFANAIIGNFTIVQGTDPTGSLQISQGNATLTLPKASAASGGSGSSSPTPFQFLQVAANTPNFVLNPDSYLRANFASAVNTGITGSTAPIPFVDGLIVWLQLDTDGSSGSFSGASIQSGQSAPYDGSGDNGTDLMTFTGGGTGPNDPFVWDESYTPLAQVFAADSSGLPVRGGVVYAVDHATPPTQIEVVQLTCTHLALRTVVNGAQAGMMALPDAGPLIS